MAFCYGREWARDAAILSKIISVFLAHIMWHVWQSESFRPPPFHTKPAMAKVALSSLLAVGGAAAFAVQPSKKTGSGLFRNRVITVRRPRISANLGNNGLLNSSLYPSIFCASCLNFEVYLNNLTKFIWQYCQVLAVLLMYLPKFGKKKN